MMAPAETADIVIVGGGVIGASIAFFLARRKVGRIVLLERDTLGSGSTGRSVASIDLFTLQLAAVELDARSHQIFSQFSDLTGGFCPVGRSRDNGRFGRSGRQDDGSRR